MYILSADCAVRIAEIRALLKFALEPTNKHSLFKHSVMNEADMINEEAHQEHENETKPCLGWSG